jgi:hypothetical protein
MRDSIVARCRQRVKGIGIYQLLPILISYKSPYTLPFIEEASEIFITSRGSPIHTCKKGPHYLRFCNLLF